MGAALHFAAQSQALEVARLLLDNGAKVDMPNRFGNTPLWTAVFNCEGDGKLIRLLRERGAGRTAADLARTIANYDVARFFDDLP